MAPRTLIAIRTNRWGVLERRLFDSLKPYWGDEIAVSFHNRPPGLDLPLRCVDINDARMEAMGLRIVPDWGWRCGDYSYYALRADFPDYDYYWLIEPDVYFANPAVGFFEAFEAADHDALGYKIESTERNHPYAPGMPDIPLKRAIFALTRFSGAAIDMCLAHRRANANLRVRPPRFANDELHMFSYCAAADLTSAGLESIAPDWFADTQFETDPDLLDRYVSARFDGTNAVVHPVRDPTSFSRALADRMTDRPKIINRVLPSLQHLSDDEREALVQDIAQRFRTAFNASQ